MTSGKTENYQLPQYAPTDHPDFLDEINSAYRVIDSALHNQTLSSSLNEQKLAKIEEQLKTLQSSVEQNTKSISSLQTDNATNKTNISNLQATTVTISSKITALEARVQKLESK